MGFWSSVSNFASSVVSGISSCVSAVGRAVSSTVSAIGSSLSSFTATMAPVLGSVFSLLPKHPVVLAVQAAVGTLSVAYRIFSANEKLESMGDSALQAAEKSITPDKFENFDDYLQALRNFKVDPSKSALTPEATKLTAAVGLVTLGLEDRLKLSNGALNQLWLLPLSNPTYFTADRMKDMLDGGLQSTDKVEDYLEQKLSGEDAASVRKDIAQAISKGQPLSTEQSSDLSKALDEARQQWAALDARLKAEDEKQEATQQALAPDGSTQQQG